MVSEHASRQESASAQRVNQKQLVPQLPASPSQKFVMVSTTTVTEKWTRTGQTKAKPVKWVSALVKIREPGFASPIGLEWRALFLRNHRSLRFAMGQITTATERLMIVWSVLATQNVAVEFRTVRWASGPSALPMFPNKKFATTKTTTVTGRSTTTSSGFVRVFVEKVKRLVFEGSGCFVVRSNRHRNCVTGKTTTAMERPTKIFHPSDAWEIVVQGLPLARLVSGVDAQDLAPSPKPVTEKTTTATGKWTTMWSSDVALPAVTDDKFASWVSGLPATLLGLEKRSAMGKTTTAMES